MQVPASICRTFLIINHNMDYSTNRGYDGKAGECLAVKEYATTDMRKGIDNPHTGSCTPGRSSRADVVYVISRQTQYIVIGAQATTWSHPPNVSYDGFCHWPDSWQQGTSYQQWGDSPGWQCAGTNIVTDSEPAQSTKATVHENECYRVKLATDYVPECDACETPEPTPIADPCKRNRAKLKLQRKRKLRKLKHRSVRIAEEALWREVDENTLDDFKGQGGNHKSVSDLRSEATSRWVASRDQLSTFLRHFWQQTSGEGELYRSLPALQNSQAWVSAKQCVKDLFLLEGMAADKVESRAEELLIDVLWEVSDSRHKACQSDDDDSDVDAEYG